MTNDHVSLFCLVNGEAMANAFSIKIPSSDTVDDLKDLIKAKQSPDFDNIVVNNLMLWHVMIPIVPANKHKPITVNEIAFKTELDPTDNISDVFEDQPPKKTIHIIIQCPPQGNADMHCFH